MQNFAYIEDIFQEFYKLVVSNGIPIQIQDRKACHSFFETIIVGNLLTENQQKYILKILDKYKEFSAAALLDYYNDLTTPVWKNPTRIIDKSKKAWIEETSECTYVCLKFPFQLKELFEKEFESQQRMSEWDSDRAVRKLPVYKINLISLNEFLVEHRFSIEESFCIALAQCEEIINQQEQIVPSFEIVDSEIKLINVAADAANWWEENRTLVYGSDILLAKAMGFRLKSLPKTTVEKIAAADTNQFWINNVDKFLDLINDIDGKICVLIDRTCNAKEWIQLFVAATDKKNIDRDLIKICFRENKNQNTGFNDWVKDHGLGGPVEEGKILIFQHKPAKWLFKDQHSVKILVTNNLYPSTNTITKDWFATHPCVVYLGDIQPSKSRNTKIVQL